MKHTEKRIKRTLYKAGAYGYSLRVTLPREFCIANGLRAGGSVTFVGDGKRLAVEGK